MIWKEDTLIIDDYSYCIANVYAHNEDNAGYFSEVFDKIKLLDCVFTIVGGGGL